MAAYFAWWIAGGFAGTIAGLLVLRYRGTLTPGALPVYASAIVGCAYGAKLQYRLRFYSPLEAALFPPSELLQPGLHIPLGLLTGLVAALIVSRLVGMPSLEIGDALAMTGAAMMPVGRVGCFLAGCCTGVACPKWLSPLCSTSGGAALHPGVPEMLVGGLAQGARPTHPLPLYFAMLGLGTVALHGWLLRRRVPPGTLLAVGLLVYPLSHLAIEQLRAGAGHRAAVLTAVLGGMIALDAIALLWLAARRRGARRRSTVRAAAPLGDERGMTDPGGVRFAARARTGRKRVSATLTLAPMLWLSSSHAHALGGDDVTFGWRATVTQYAQDPLAHRRAMMALGREGVADLPPMAQLAIADAYLRSNRFRSAARVFDSLLEQDAGDPWSGLASLGRGWVAARRGRTDEARHYFARAAEGPGSSGLLGDFMVGMIDAGDGLGSEAIVRFARIQESQDASQDLRVAATMGEGYARFWMGDDAGARAAFSRAATAAPEHGIAEDARFADALARWREGDVAGAEERLSALAGAEGEATPAEATGLASLDPRALLRASARRYKHLPLGMPADQLLAMLDGDAGAMARVALRRLRMRKAPPAPIAPAAASHRAARVESSRDAEEPGRPTAVHEAATNGDVRAIGGRRGFAIVAGLALVSLALFALRGTGVPRSSAR